MLAGIYSWDMTLFVTGGVDYPLNNANTGELVANFEEQTNVGLWWS